MTIKSVLIDRRTFLSAAGMTAGAVVATSLVPLSVVHAVTPCAAFVGGTGHVDDVCGHWPPYSHAIGYRHVAEVSLTTHAEPIDHVLMI